MSETPASGGLLAATRNSAATLLASGRTRLELLGNEIREEKLRAVHLLLLSQAVAFCLMISLILAIALLVVVFWDSRVFVLGGFTALFALIDSFAYIALRRAMRRGQSIFATSIAQLGEDLQQLRTAAGNESRPD